MNPLYKREIEGRTYRPLRKLSVYPEGGSALKIGMKIRVCGTVKPLEPDRNPGQFDYRQYAWAKGICGSMSGETLVVVDERYHVIREWLRIFGLVLEKKLEQIAEEEDVGLLKAILLGDKDDMDDDVYRLFQKNGISHVLAISGLHVSVIGMGIWNGLRILGAGYWGAGITAFVMLFCYGTIAGFGPSVIRAVFMMGLSFLAGGFGRTYDLPSAMSVPAMGLLLWHPYVLTQASFQLSFLAVFAIFFPGAYLAKMWKLPFRWQNVWTSISIQLVTIPAVLYHSFEVPLYGLILNLLVVPLMTYVLVSGILGLLGAFLWLPLGTFLLGGAHYILAFYRWLCEWMARISGSYLVLGRPSFLSLVCYYGCLIGGAWIIGSGWSPGRWKATNDRHLVKKRLGLMAVIWLMGGLCLLPVAPEGLQVTFLDVGQGDGIVMQVDGKAILIDGGSSQEKTLGEDCLIPFLKSRGISYLDMIVVTHGDSDHISGIRYLLEEKDCGIDIGLLLMPVTGIGDKACEDLGDLAAGREIPVFYMSRDGAWERGLEQEDNKSNQKKFVMTEPDVFWNRVIDKDGQITCLYPYGGPEAVSSKDVDRNNGSLVLKVEYGHFSMVLTGDVEEEGEKRMIERGLDGPITVLKAAHHGSASSSTPQFLEHLSPSYVIFSFGAGNRYGHPAGQVVENCQKLGAGIWKTAESGAVSIRTDGRQMWISGWLDRQEGI